MFHASLASSSYSVMDAWPLANCWNLIIEFFCSVLVVKWRARWRAAISDSVLRRASSS
jgi:hypothetical protein